MSQSRLSCLEEARQSSSNYHLLDSITTSSISGGETEYYPGSMEYLGAKVYFNYKSKCPKSKGNDTVSVDLQRIKAARDKLSAVRVQIDSEEMIHVLLKGLPKDYAPFSLVMKTQDDSLTSKIIHFEMS